MTKIEVFEKISGSSSFRAMVFKHSTKKVTATPIDTFLLPMCQSCIVSVGSCSLSKEYQNVFTF